MKTFANKFFFLLILSFISVKLCLAQVSSGKLIYERKTNLHKKFKGDTEEWIKDVDKIKIDEFELIFNDSLSVFKLKESELKEQMEWTTEKNTVYQNFATKRKFTIKSIWGEKFNVADTLTYRKWKITDSHRNIAGFNCRKAIWEANDSTRIYAWYCNEISVSSGPESFNGLPGLILGLATEDGSVIYFAKQIVLAKQTSLTLLPEKTKAKTYTTKELRDKLTKDFGKKNWGKAMINETFDIW